MVRWALSFVLIGVLEPQSQFYPKSLHSQKLAHTHKLALLAKFSREIHLVLKNPIYGGFHISFDFL